jgi:hypothetical protein
VIEIHDFGISNPHRDIFIRGRFRAALPSSHPPRYCEVPLWPFQPLKPASGAPAGAGSFFLAARF